MKARRWKSLGGALLAAGWLLPAAALPPAVPEVEKLRETAEPVNRIPTADSVLGFEPLDSEHVMLSTEDRHYLLTLNQGCFGLRFARHVGVTTSDNTIWAGFDTLTADGEACAIREIHVVEPGLDSL